jgi:hypothetical protein
MLLRRDETGDRKHAVELLDAAARTTEELGMDGLREASTRLRQSAAVRGVSLRGDRG